MSRSTAPKRERMSDVATREGGKLRGEQGWAQGSHAAPP